MILKEPQFRFLRAHLSALNNVETVINPYIAVDGLYAAILMEPIYGCCRLTL